MFAKTVCKPGSYLCIVPVGLLVTLQYNANGRLEKVFEGYGEDKMDKSADLLPYCTSAKSVPNKIKVTGGTTWVEGVIYTSRKFAVSGMLPMALSKPIISEIANKPESCTFYAANVSSLAAPFPSFLAISNWLKMSGFYTLPGYLMFAGMSDKGFNDMLTDTNSPFEYPLYSGFFIFEGSEARYHRLNLRQDIVVSTADFIDDSGYFKSSVIFDGGKTKQVHRSDSCRYGLVKGSVVVSDSSSTIIYSSTSSNSNMNIVCPVCGNSFSCNDSGPIVCSDPNCASHLTEWFSHFCHVAKLLEMPNHDLMEAILNKSVTCFSDIFLLPPYSELTCDLDLFTFLRAIVPTDVCSNDVVLSRLCALSGNVLDTFYYYLRNLDRLAIELSDLSSTPQVARLLEWLSNPYITCTITTLLDNNQFKLSDSGKLFEGAPIFRGRSIAITGTFRRGSSKDIMNIFKSYGADVTIGFQEGSDCLVIGELNDRNDGRSIQRANASGTPIHMEDAFFTQFDIDADLNQHFYNQL